MPKLWSTLVQEIVHSWKLKVYIQSYQVLANIGNCVREWKQNPISLTHTRTHAHTHTHTHTRTHTHARTHTHTHTLTHTNTQTRTQTRTHIRTHTYTQAFTQTQTCVHVTLLNPQGPGPCQTKQVAANSWHKCNYCTHHLSGEVVYQLEKAQLVQQNNSTYQIFFQISLSTSKILFVKNRKLCWCRDVKISLLHDHPARENMFNWAHASSPTF